MKLRKGYSDEKMEEMFQSGELLKILKEPRGRKKKVRPIFRSASL
jgi:hypothetical protein